MARHIRLITPITTAAFRPAESVEAMQAPGLRVTHRLLNSGPPSIESEFDEAFALPETVIAAMEAEHDGADAVVIDCMGDPGVRAAREALTIPVVGPSEASMHLAAMLGGRFSVVTVLESVVPMFENAAALAGLERKLASVRCVDIPVLELEADLGRLHEALIREAAAAIRDQGADVIIFGCTGMMGCAEAVRAGLLAQGLDAPVIDPVPAAVRLALALVESGLSHSKRRFPRPRPKTMRGYDVSAA